MIIMKFGGSSIQNAEMFKKVALIVNSKINRKPIIVLSAVEGVTDNLISSLDECLEGKFDCYEEIVKTHKTILKELGLREDLVNDELIELRSALEITHKIKVKDMKILDYISFFGERMSVKILASYLRKIGINSQSFISGNLGLITDSNFGEANILDSSFKKIQEELLKLNVLPVITGFGGKNEEGAYTTFSRGGSDYVASLIGSSIEAEEIQIWTDVNGIMSADPEIVENAKTIPELSFDEASELAYFGIKVLHPKTILPAIKRNIPVVVLNTLEPEHQGSRIMQKSKEHDGLVKAISYKKNIVIMDVKSTRMINSVGYLAKIFEVFKKYGKSVDMISTSEIHVSISVDSKKNLDKIEKDLEEISSVKIHDEKAIIYVVGSNLKHRIGIAVKIFNILAKNNINIEIISQCFEEISIGLVINEINAEEAVRLLHKELID